MKLRSVQRLLGVNRFHGLNAHNSGREAAPGGDPGCRVFGHWAVLQAPGFNMVRRFAQSRRGKAAALFSLSGLLCSCNTVSTSPAAQAAAPADSTPHVEVSDTFGIPELEARFEEVAKHAAPAVVAISATDAKLNTDEALRSNSLTPEKLAALLEPVDRTVGTGFIVDSDGYIVTNDHVVSSNDNIWVTTDDHHVYPAIVVGSDPRSDLAVLKIPATKLPTVRFSESPARRGQWTLALGNPYGLAGTGDMALSVGIVSATGRSLTKLSSKEDRLYSNLIQTTAQINPGNSGGPLFDVRGEVMGINSAVILPQKSTNGIGFAIPANAQVRRIIDELKQGQEVVYGYLGVRVTSPTPLERTEAGLSEEVGAKIESVELDSPAFAAKLRAGDIVTSFDGQAVADGDQFVRLVGETPVDHPVTAMVYRDRKPTPVSLSTARRQAPLVAITRDNQRNALARDAPRPHPPALGFRNGIAPHGRLDGHCD